MALLGGFGVRVGGEGGVESQGQLWETNQAIKTRTVRTVESWRSLSWKCWSEWWFRSGSSWQNCQCHMNCQRFADMYRLQLTFKGVVVLNLQFHAHKTFSTRSLWFFINSKHFYYVINLPTFKCNNLGYILLHKKAEKISFYRLDLELISWL